LDIKFINCNVDNLELKDNYDYMFLSNISDYLNLIYDQNVLEKYNNLINKFKKNVSHIYMAYIYDINKTDFRSEIDDIKLVKKIFGNVKIIEVKTALEDKKETKDGVLIVEGEI